MNTYIIDIDDTILFSKYENGEYVYIESNKKVIDKINNLYDYNIIVISTGRNWGHLLITIEQLKQAGVKYHTLVMGKPPGIVVDDKALRPDEFLGE